MSQASQDLLPCPAPPRPAPPRRIVRLCSERPVLLRQFEGQHLANLLWGLCRAGFKPPLEFLELMARVRGGCGLL